MCKKYLYSNRFFFVVRKLYREKKCSFFIDWEFLFIKRRFFKKNIILIKMGREIWCHRLLCIRPGKKWIYLFDFTHFTGIFEKPTIKRTQIKWSNLYTFARIDFIFFILWKILQPWTLNFNRFLFILED